MTAHSAARSPFAAVQQSSIHVNNSAVSDMTARYERAFRALLWRVRPRHLQVGVSVLEAKVRTRLEAGESHQSAFQSVYARARQQVIQRLARGRIAKRLNGLKGPSDREFEHACRTFASVIPETPGPDSADFHCDSGLGGLARWLRASGYDARFWPHIADDELVRLTVASCAILITTDQPLMNRSMVRWGGLPAVLAPLQAGKLGQFEFVARTLSLPRKPGRCMNCGGLLSQVQKEAVRERIPPRTYPWLDDYFLCDRCGQLFWHGTHWQRVDGILHGVIGTSGMSGPE